MMVKCDLLENEKLVLYGLVRYPSLTDRELYEKLGFKRSTFSTIKNKLKREGYYTTINIPNMARLGCELLVMGFGNFTKLRIAKIKEMFEASLSTDVGKKDLPLLKEINMFSELSDSIFFEVFDERGGIFLCVNKNYTELKKMENDFAVLNEKYNLMDEETVFRAIFPFNLTKFLNFFDYSLLLKQDFGIEIEEREKKMNLESGESSPRKLSKKEKRVYYGLVKYPDLSDSKMAEKISESRSTVANIRRKFESGKLLRKCRIPNLKKLGFKILIFFFHKIDSRISSKMREKGIKIGMQVFPHIFGVVENLEITSIGVFREFENRYEKTTEFIRSTNESLSRPREQKSFIVSISDMEIPRNCDFSPLVKKVLGITDME
jgi:DNA-binding MarR family transcriptional regulator